MAKPVDEAAHSVLLLGSTTDLGALRTHNVVQQRQAQFVDATRRLLQSETMVNMLTEAGVELPSLEDLEMGKRRGGTNARGDWRSTLNKNHAHSHAVAGPPDTSETGDGVPVSTPEGAPPSSTATPLAPPGMSPPRSPRRNNNVRGGWRQHINREANEAYEKNPVVRRLKKLRHKVLYGKVGEKAYSRYKATLRANLTWRDILRPNLAAAKKNGHNQPGFSRWLDTAITEEQRRAVRDEAARVIQAAWRIFKKFRVDSVMRHVRNFELGKYNWSDDDSVATDELPDWWGDSSDEEEGGEEGSEEGGGRKKKKKLKKKESGSASLKRTPSMVKKRGVLAQVAGALDEASMGDAVVEGATKRKKKKKKKGGPDGGDDGEDGGEAGADGDAEDPSTAEAGEAAEEENGGGGKGKKGKKGKGKKVSNAGEDGGADEEGDGGEDADGGGEGDGGGGGTAPMKKAKSLRRKSSKRLPTTTSSTPFEDNEDADDLLTDGGSSGQVLDAHPSRLSVLNLPGELSGPLGPPPPLPPPPPKPAPSVPAPLPSKATGQSPAVPAAAAAAPAAAAAAQQPTPKRKKGKKAAKGDASNGKGVSASNAISREASRQDLHPTDSSKSPEPLLPPSPSRRVTPSPPPLLSRQTSKSISPPPPLSASASWISNAASGALSLSAQPSVSDAGRQTFISQRKSMDGRRGTALKTTDSGGEEEDEEEDEDDEDGARARKRAGKKKGKKKVAKKPESEITPRNTGRTVHDTPDWSKVGPSAALFDVKTDPEKRAGLLARMARDGGPNWRPPGVVADWYHMSQYLYDGDDPDKRAAAMAKVAETMAANGQPLWRHAGAAATTHFYSMSRSLYDGDDPKKRAEALAKAVAAPVNPMWRPPGIGPGIGPPKYDSGLFDGEPEKETPRPAELPPWRPPGVPRVEYYNYYSAAPSSSNPESISNSTTHSGEDPESGAVSGETPEERAARRRERRASRRGPPLSEVSSGSLGSRINGRTPWRFTYAVEEELVVPGNDPAQVRYDNITRDDKGAPRPWKYTTIPEPNRSMPYNIWGPYVDPSSNPPRAQRSESLLAQASRNLAEGAVTSRSRSGAASQMSSPRPSRPSAATTAAAAAAALLLNPAASTSGGSAAADVAATSDQAAVAAAATASSSTSGASVSDMGAAGRVPSAVIVGLPSAVDTEAPSVADRGPRLSDFEGTGVAVGWGTGVPAQQPPPPAPSPRPWAKTEPPLRRNMSFPRVDMHMPSTRRTHSALYRMAGNTVAVVPSHIVLLPEVVAAANAVASLVAVSTNDSDSAVALRGLPYQLSVMGRHVIAPSPTGYDSSDDCSVAGDADPSFSGDDEGRRRHSRTLLPGHPLRGRPSQHRRSQARGHEGVEEALAPDAMAKGAVAAAAATAAAVAAATAAAAEGSGGQGLLGAEGTGNSVHASALTAAGLVAAADAVATAAAAAATGAAGAGAASALVLSREASSALSLSGKQQALLSQQLLLLQQRPAHKLSFKEQQRLEALQQQQQQQLLQEEPIVRPEGSSVAGRGLGPGDEASIEGMPSQLPPASDPSAPSLYDRPSGNSWSAGAAGSLSYALSSRRRSHLNSRRMSEGVDGMYDSAGGGGGRRDRDVPQLYPPALSSTAELAPAKRICSARRRGAFTTAGIQPYPLDPELLKSLPSHVQTTNARARSAPGSPRGSFLNDDSAPGGVGNSAGAAEASGAVGIGAGMYGYAYGEGDGGPVSGGGLATGSSWAGSHGGAVLNREDLPPLPAILQDPRAQEFFTARGARIATQRRLAAKGSAQPDPRAMCELLFVTRPMQPQQLEPYGGAAAAGGGGTAAAASGGGGASSSQSTHLSPRRRAAGAALADAHVRAQARLGSPVSSSRSQIADPSQFGPSPFGQLSWNRSSLLYTGLSLVDGELPSPGMIAAAAAATAGSIVPPAPPLAAWELLSMTERGSWTNGSLPLQMPPQHSVSQQRLGVVQSTTPVPSGPHFHHQQQQLLQQLLLQQLLLQQQTAMGMHLEQQGSAASVLRSARTGSLPPLPQAASSGAAAGSGPSQLQQQPLPPLPAGMHPSADLIRRSAPAPTSSSGTAAGATLLAHGSASSLSYAQYTVSVPAAAAAADGRLGAPADGPIGRRGSASVRELDTAVAVATAAGGSGGGGSEAPPPTGRSSGSGRMPQPPLAAAQSASRSGSRAGSREGGVRSGGGTAQEGLSGGGGGGGHEGGEEAGGGGDTRVVEPAAVGAVTGTSTSQSGTTTWTALPPIPVALQLQLQPPPPPSLPLQAAAAPTPLQQQAVQHQQQAAPPPLPSAPSTQHQHQQHTLHQAMQFQHIYMPAQHQAQGSPQVSSRTHRISVSNASRQSTPPSAAAASNAPGRPPTTTTPRLPAVGHRRLLPPGDAAAAAAAAAAAPAAAAGPTWADDDSPQRRKLKGQLRVGRAPLGAPLTSRVPERPPGAAAS